MPIRRTVGRDGRVYYFNNRGQRLSDRSGARRYVRENFEQIDRTNLTPREQRSFAASERARNQYRFDGRFVPNPFGIFDRFLRANQLPPETRNLTNLFNREQLMRILDQRYTQDLVTFRNFAQNIFETHRDRQGDLLDSYQDIRNYMRGGYTFTLVLDGQRYEGNEALAELRDWEAQRQEFWLGERGDLLENVEFRHRIRLNPANRTIEIDIDETDEIPRGGTP